jgi:hypothetical protein
MNDLFPLYLFHLHVFVSLVGILGMCMFYYWATRNLPPERLKKWAVTIFAIGAVGVLVTVPACLLSQTLVMFH